MTPPCSCISGAVPVEQPMQITTMVSPHCLDGAHPFAVQPVVDSSPTTCILWRSSELPSCFHYCYTNTSYLQSSSLHSQKSPTLTFPCPSPLNGSIRRERIAQAPKPSTPSIKSMALSFGSVPTNSVSARLPHCERYMLAALRRRGGISIHL